MTDNHNTLAATAHAVLDGSARGDDAKRLARWVLERERAERLAEFNHAHDCNWTLFVLDCDCWGDHAP